MMLSSVSRGVVAALPPAVTKGSAPARPNAARSQFLRLPVSVRPLRHRQLHAYLIHAKQGTLQRLRVLFLE